MYNPYYKVGGYITKQLFDKYWDTCIGDRFTEAQLDILMGFMESSTHFVPPVFIAHHCNVSCRYYKYRKTCPVHVCFGIYDIDEYVLIRKTEVWDMERAGLFAKLFNAFRKK